MRYVKRPVEVEAIQWTGDNLEELQDFCRICLYRFGNLYIQTQEGRMRANLGDWIIQGVAGEFYPCKPDIFEATYEAAP